MKKKWFESPFWDETVENEFYKRLKRSKTSFHRAQYMRIQASHLLRNDEKNQQNKGIELINKVINEFSDDYYNVMLAHITIGSYYRRVGQYNDAIKHFEIVREYNTTATMRFDFPEMLIAMTIIEAGDKSNYKYGLELMKKVDPRKLFVPELKKRYFETLNILIGNN